MPGHPRLFLPRLARTWMPGTSPGMTVRLSINNNEKTGNKNMHVKGKVCVVTGGASGIGEAVARAYAEAGAKGVVGADLKTSRERLAKCAGGPDGPPGTAHVWLEKGGKGPGAPGG